MGLIIAMAIFSCFSAKSARFTFIGIGREQRIFWGGYLSLMICIGTLPALTLNGYTALENDRWSNTPTVANGTFTANADASFIGLPYDLSGVGWTGNGGGSYKDFSMAMLSPIHFAGATHVGYGYINASYYFRNTSGNLVTRTIGSTLNKADFGSDGRMVRLDNALTAPDNVSFYRVMDAGVMANYTGKDALLYGHKGDGTFQRRLAYSTVSGTSGTYVGFNNAIGTDSYATTYVVGDSGSPSFIRSGTDLTLLGSHYSTPLWDNNWADTTMYAGANAFMASSGYAIRWTIDSANARSWTGATDGSFATTTNWAGGNLPDATTSAVFNGGTTANRTLSVGSPATLRGMLIQNAAGSNGFTLSGSALTLGASGIRNEDGDTLTINNAITLGDSQNWEAIGGGISASGAIDTNGKLLVLSGTQAMNVTGNVTGAGNVAWDNPGTWTLNAGQMANTGTVFVHRGTLQLGTGASLAGQSLQLAQESTAVFNLNGQSQTLTSLTGNAGSVNINGGTLTLGTGNYSYTGNIALGGGNLVLNNAASAMTYSSNLTGSGTVRVLSSGSNAAVIASASGWTGDLMIGNTSGAYGVARFNSAASLPVGNIIFDSSYNTWGNALTFGLSGTATVSNNIQFRRPSVSGQNIDITANTAASNLTFSGNLTTSTINGTQTFGNLQFNTGNNSLTLTGNNDFTGVGNLRINQSTGGANAVTNFTVDASALNNAGTLTLQNYAGNNARINVRASEAGTYTTAISANHQSLGGTTGVVASVGGSQASGNVIFSGNLTFDSANLATAGTTVNLHTENAGTRTVYSGLLSDGAQTVNVTVSGNGTTALIRAAGNSYDGTTTVQSGTLLLNNTSGSATGTGALTVNSGATLGGTGTVTGAITLQNGATFTPGDGGIGTFTGSALTWNGGAGLTFELGSGTTSDRLNLSGAFTKGTGSVFAFNFQDAGWQTGSTYTLLNFGSNSGFTLGDFSFTNGGLTGNFALSASNLQFSVASVPEPKTYALLCSGIFLLFLVRFVRRKATGS